MSSSSCLALKGLEGALRLGEDTFFIAPPSAQVGTSWIRGLAWEVDSVQFELMLLGAARAGKQIWDLIFMSLYRLITTPHQTWSAGWPRSPMTGPCCIEKTPILTVLKHPKLSEILHLMRLSVPGSVIIHFCGRRGLYTPGPGL